MGRGGTRGEVDIDTTIKRRFRNAIQSLIVANPINVGTLVAYYMSYSLLSLASSPADFSNVSCERVARPKAMPDTGAAKLSEAIA